MKWETQNVRGDRGGEGRLGGKGQANVNSIHDDVFTICILDQNEIDKDREREKEMKIEKQVKYYSFGVVLIQKPIESNGSLIVVILLIIKAKSMMREYSGE